MTRTVLFSAIAAAASLLGCAGMGIMQSQDCRQPGVCKVAVTLGKDCTAPNGVSAPDINVYGNKGQKTVIQWDIDPKEPYSFVSQKGIVIKAGGNQFDPPQHGPKRVTVVDHHTDTNSYKYDVNVMKTDGTLCWVLDPWINNK